MKTEIKIIPLSSKKFMVVTKVEGRTMSEVSFSSLEEIESQAGTLRSEAVALASKIEAVEKLLNQ